MIPRVRPSYDWSDLKAALQACQSEVDIFESELASYFGVKYAIAFPYGRSVIHSFLKAFDLAGGDVIQPAYNCVVVAHATKIAGCNPVFVDAQSKSPNQNSDEMLEKITSHTVAVIPTSIFGMTFDAEALSRVIRNRNPNTYVLIDCAQCFNTSWENKLLAKQGDAAILAFGIGKPMTTLYGGALLTDRDDIFSKVRSYRDRTFVSPSTGALLESWFYYLASWVALSGPFVSITNWMEHAHTPLNSYLQKLRARETIKLPANNQVFMKPMEAGIGRSQLKRVSNFMQRRREIAAIYAQELSNINGIEILDWQHGATYAIYASRLKKPEFRTQILDTMNRYGIQGDTVLNYVVPGLACYRTENYSAEPFPNAVAWSQSVINFPNHPTMTNQQVYDVVEALKQAIKGTNG